MKFVAFFRNLNLGRPPAPTRAALEQAFSEAGATHARSFQTNGTLVYEARSLAAARRVLKSAQAALKADSGFAEPAFLRPMSQLAELVASAPFAGVDTASVYDCCVTFLGDKLAVPAGAPTTNTRGDVEVLAYTGSEALAVSRKFGASPGSPNAFIERTFGQPASTRAWSTLARLVAAHA
jgi:uncharacterized protein (DUF1697 family)